MYSAAIQKQVFHKLLSRKPDLICLPTPTASFSANDDEDDENDNDGQFFKLTIEDSWQPADQYGMGQDNTIHGAVTGPGPSTVKYQSAAYHKHYAQVHIVQC